MIKQAPRPYPSRRRLRNVVGPADDGLRDRTGIGLLRIQQLRLQLSSNDGSHA